MDTLTVLRDARALIEDSRNWTRSVLCDRAGRRCALGAIGAVVYGSDFARDPETVTDAEYDVLEVEPAVEALAAVIPESESDLPPVVRIFHANDKAGGHHGKVLALFDRAIAAEEAKLREVVPQATPRRRDDAGCERVAVAA